MSLFPPLFAPVKINLCLRVFNKRPDNYHNLKSLVVFANIGNIISAKKSTIDSISIGGKFKDSLNNNCHENTIFKIINWLRKNNCCIPPLSISLIKSIPFKAGLGSGSADAGAVLRALFKNQEEACAITKFSYDEFNNQLCSIGCDIPACVISSPLWMLSKGEVVKKIKCFPPTNVIILKPNFGVSTKNIFSNYNSIKNSISVNDEVTNEIDYVKLIELLKSNNNDLLSTVVRYSQNYGKIINEWNSFNEFDASGMSGSGTSLFALIKKDNINKIKAKLNKSIADPNSPLFSSSIFNLSTAGTTQRPYNRWGQWLN